MPIQRDPLLQFALTHFALFAVSRAPALAANYLVINEVRLMDKSKVSYTDGFGAKR